MNGIEQQKAYWLRQLSAPPPPPKLPWDKERPPVSSFVRDTFSTKLHPEVWRGINDLAARADATPRVVLLAALKTLLFRYTGQTDLIVGSVLSKNSGASQHQIVALRTEIMSHGTALELVLQVAASVREARECLDLPFGAVLDMLGNQLDAREGGLFNAALIFLIFQEPDPSPAQPARPVEFAGAEHLMTCALVLYASEADDGLTLSCEYDAELFDAATIERLAGHFGNLLAGMTAESQTPLDRLNLSGAAELRQLLVEWNATQTGVPKAACIHQLIEAQAKKTPDSVAAICRDRQLTYAELNTRANQVASYLSKLGVGPEALVGLCADRSLEMLVGLLGILKSGGAYLPRA